MSGFKVTGGVRRKSDPAPEKRPSFEDEVRAFMAAALEKGVVTKADVEKQRPKKVDRVA